MKDLRGYESGSLVAVEPTDMRASGGSVIWRCLCRACGGECLVAANNLQAGQKTCGCRVGRKASDISGERFGRLVAVEPTDRRMGGSVVWRCECDCGSEAFASHGSLTSGNIRSCGCLRRESYRAARNAKAEASLSARAGERHGSLVVVGPVTGAGRTMALLECDCGRRVVRSTGNIRNMRDGSTCGKHHGKPLEHTLGGMRFGKLLALKEVRLRGYVAYDCLCDCGRRVTVRASELEGGRRTQCLPFDHRLLGRRFGKLVVRDYAGSDGGSGAVMLCECDCGNTCEVPARQIKNGNTRSCGCGEEENRAANMRAHSARVHVEGTNLATISAGGVRPDNKSGVTGVFQAKNGRWKAEITFRKKRRSLGTFDTLEEAAAARLNAEDELFGPVLERHGRKLGK